GLLRLPGEEEGVRQRLVGQARLRRPPHGLSARGDGRGYVSLECQQEREIGLGGIEVRILSQRGAQVGLGGSEVALAQPGDTAKRPRAGIIGSESDRTLQEGEGGGGVAGGEVSEGEAERAFDGSGRRIGE